jgi:hypothetical protein
MDMHTYQVSHIWRVRFKTKVTEIELLNIESRDWTDTADTAAIESAQKGFFCVRTQNLQAKNCFRFHLFYFNFL